MVGQRLRLPIPTVRQEPSIVGRLRGPALQRMDHLVPLRCETVRPGEPRGPTGSHGGPMFPPHHLRVRRRRCLRLADRHRRRSIGSITIMPTRAQKFGGSGGGGPPGWQSMPRRDSSVRIARAASVSLRLKCRMVTNRAISPRRWWARRSCQRHHWRASLGGQRGSTSRWTSRTDHRCACVQDSQRRTASKGIRTAPSPPQRRIPTEVTTTGWPTASPTASICSPGGTSDWSASSDAASQLVTDHPLGNGRPHPVTAPTAGIRASRADASAYGSLSGGQRGGRRGRTRSIP